MGKPRPLPPPSRSRASSSRVKRSKTSSRSAAGMPCPSSEMVSSTLLAVTRVVTPTSRSAWRTALSSRFVRARVRLSRATPTSNTPLPPTVCRRTRTRAPAYRPTTSGSSRLRSLSELTGVLVSSSARARSRRSSTSPESRWTSARRSAGSCPPSPRRWATSSWVRMLASGLRSSWAASATNDRCLRRAPATRSSMSLSVVARALISSPDGVHGQPLGVRRGLVDLGGAVAQRLHRPQGRADDPSLDRRQHGEQQGEEHEQEGAQRPAARLEVGRRRRRHDGDPVR